jgi:hypothetical protein
MIKRDPESSLPNFIFLFFFSYCLGFIINIQHTTSTAMGQSPSKIDEKEAVAGMARLSLDKNTYVFVDNDTRT